MICRAGILNNTIKLGKNERMQAQDNNYCNHKFNKKKKPKFLFLLWILPIFLSWIVMRCAIWYHLYNLKNVKNTHAGELLSLFCVSRWF